MQASRHLERGFQLLRWVRWGGQSGLSAPDTIADFDPGRDVDNYGEAAVVAKDGLTAEADEPVDLWGIWIGRDKRSRHGSKFA